MLSIKTHLSGEHLLGSPSSLTHATPSPGRKLTWRWNGTEMALRPRDMAKAGCQDVSLVELPSDRVLHPSAHTHKSQELPSPETTT